MVSCSDIVAQTDSFQRNLHLQIPFSFAICTVHAPYKSSNNYSRGRLFFLSPLKAAIIRGWARNLAVRDYFKYCLLEVIIIIQLYIITKNITTGIQNMDFLQFSQNFLFVTFLL